MTSSIKPPGSSAPQPPPSAKSPDEGSRAGGADGGVTAPSFAEAAVRANASDAAATSSRPSAELPPPPVTPFDALAAALTSGEIDTTDAVSALVERALDSPMAAALTDRGRERLAEHLRDSLANDPTLSGMVRDLERRS